MSVLIHNTFRTFGSKLLKSHSHLTRPSIFEGSTSQVSRTIKKNICNGVQYQIPVTSTIENIRNFSTTHQSLEKCALTRERYQIKRGNYNEITPDDVSFFKSVLGDSAVITEDLEGYNTDWINIVRGESQVLLRPRTTDEVSRVLRHCNDRRLAVCPQGGNTGLVGGSVPVFDEVILSTSLMNNIENVDELSGVLTCQSGCVLQTLDQHLEQHGLMMPLDLGAKGSCQIGGNVSTNAGGLRLLRYGSLHGSVLGVEAVMASGEVLDCMCTLRKDNTGYHLKHLLIGAEGTLGVVTKVAILCPRRPQSVSLALLSVDGFNSALAICQRAKIELGEILSSCEFIDGSSMECVTSHFNLTLPVTEAACYMIIETAGSNSDHDQEKLESFLSTSLSDSSGVTDGTLVTESSRMDKIWALRERIVEALLLEGHVFKYDVSLPMQEFYNLVLKTQAHMGDTVSRCCGYGHLGDGNLHLNVTIPQYNQEAADRLVPWIYEETARMRGSISAEHGLGFMKRNYIGHSKHQSAVNLMMGIKKLMDPNGILNPYKVLPDH